MSTTPLDLNAGESLGRTARCDLLQDASEFHCIPVTFLFEKILFH
jgi:hypothetical protein